MADSSQEFGQPKSISLLTLIFLDIMYFTMSCLRYNFYINQRPETSSYINIQLHNYMNSVNISVISV